MNIPGIGKAILPPQGFDALLEKPRLKPLGAKAEPPPLESFARSHGPGRPARSAANAPNEMPLLHTGRAQVLSRRAADPADPLWKAAQEFEALMLTQMFEAMFAGVKSEGLFGGGHAERTYRTFLMHSYGESVVESGGVGIAEAVYRDIAQAYRQTSEDT